MNTERIGYSSVIARFAGKGFVAVGFISNKP
jgi:hypothetical protein